MKIDAHQHFWKLSRGDYGWLTPDLRALYRDYGPSDLIPLLKQCGVDGTLLVQAAPTIAETEYLLSIADQHPFVLGVVGWVDFDHSDATQQIAKFAQHPKLCGLRPMIQDIPDNQWMLRPSVGAAVDAMIAHDLTFDALVLPQHLKVLNTFIQRHPNLRVVIDHGAKPDIRNAQFDEWAADIAGLARNEQVFCKLSGLATEARSDWTPADLAPYIAHLIDSFDATRLIWGSDWPVATSAVGYSAWHDMVQDYAGENAHSIFGANAQRAYRLR
ncbi:amidohydrolase family protein [Loktanella sp. S4079]|uniref:amidohydrolase family protein n=1 Tax=Loktanella sp. S4079 TaxID=579483 RepID=UPI0005F9E423|nr:amidohydrolase family protein [Loktanella sp. S4079]KJZ18315.1 amidohydrolase [Loktanella sp. S4079]